MSEEDQCRRMSDEELAIAEQVARVATGEVWHYYYTDKGGILGRVVEGNVTPNLYPLSVDGFLAKADIDFITYTDPRFVLRLVSELRQSREREEKLQRHNIGLYEEIQEAQDTLAEALGYAFDEEHGWVTGEHTVVTLALEAKSKLQGYRRTQ